MKSQVAEDKENDKCSSEEVSTVIFISHRPRITTTALMGYISYVNCKYANDDANDHDMTSYNTQAYVLLHKNFQSGDIQCQFLFFIYLQVAEFYQQAESECFWIVILV